MMATVTIIYPDQRRTMFLKRSRMHSIVPGTRFSTSAILPPVNAALCNHRVKNAAWTQPQDPSELPQAAAPAFLRLLPCVRLLPGCRAHSGQHWTQDNAGPNGPWSKVRPQEPWLNFAPPEVVSEAACLLLRVWLQPQSGTYQQRYRHPPDQIILARNQGDRCGAIREAHVEAPGR